jgi:hypothetical protein
MSTMPDGQGSATNHTREAGALSPPPLDAPRTTDPQTPGRWSRWGRPAAAAWMASAIIHLLILLIAAFITVGGGHIGGARPGDPETIGIAVLTESELGNLFDTAIDANSPIDSESLDHPLAVHVDLQMPDSASAFDQPLHLGETGDALTTGLGAGDLGDGLVGGAGGGASFFGVEAQGTRFAFVIDISGSMSVGVGVSNLTRLDILKNELHSAIGALNENAQFLVILFDDESKAMGGRFEWTRATESGKTWARRAIALIEARGGTVPLPAFSMVYSIRPRPDAIYFMTDGEFDVDAPRQIAILNGNLRIPIHTICFDSREGEALMQKIATESGGTYTFVPGVRR